MLRRGRSPKHGASDHNHSGKEEHGSREGRSLLTFRQKGEKELKQILFRGEVEREKESMGRGLSLLRRFKRPVICVGGIGGGCLWKRGLQKGRHSE